VTQTESLFFKERSSASRADARRLAQLLEIRADAVAREATEAMFREASGYRDLRGTPQGTDVHAHARAQIEALVRFLKSGEPVTPEDLLFTRQHTARRAGRVSLADFVQAWMIWQQTLWNEIRQVLPDEISAETATDLFGDVCAFLKVAATFAAESYTEAEQVLATTGERVRQDLLEDLLARKDIQPGPGLAAARTAGLEAGHQCIVLSARPVAEVIDEHALRGAASTLARSLGSATPPLSVIRRDEIVILTRLATPLDEAHEQRIHTAQGALEQQGLGLAVGVSTAYTLFDEVADAYAEASDASSRQLPASGVVLLSRLSVFEYLTARADRTSRRLVSGGAATFAAEDQETGGVLIATVQAYAASNMQVRQTAEALNVHVNTVRHRLARVEERTGRNLHSIDDVIELLIAIRLSA
jgi:sugar diacid utilization regulator